MKSVKTYIHEALISSKHKIKPIYTCHPKNALELIKIIRQRIDKYGWECDLNDIDVSKIKRFIDVFAKDTWFDISNFDGNITNWDVSNCTHFTRMFLGSKFTGKNSDLSKWNVSNGKVFSAMFSGSSFNEDISNWKINSDNNTDKMFENCLIEEKYKPKGVK